MSADNWGICPKCKKLELQHKKQLEEDARKLYGKISPEDYLQLLKEIPDKKALDETLREDYEIGVDSHGEFYISYGCHCDKCGVKHSFNYKEQLSLE